MVQYGTVRYGGWCGMVRGGYTQWLAAAHRGRRLHTVVGGYTQWYAATHSGRRLHTVVGSYTPW